MLFAGTSRRRRRTARCEGWLPRPAPLPIQAGLGPLITRPAARPRPPRPFAAPSRRRRSRRSSSRRQRTGPRLHLADLGDVVRRHLLDLRSGELRRRDPAPAARRTAGRSPRQRASGSRWRIVPAPPCTQKIGGRVPLGWIGTSEVHGEASSRLSISSASFSIVGARRSRRAAGFLPNSCSISANSARRRATSRRGRRSCR